MKSVFVVLNIEFCRLGETKEQPDFALAPLY